MERLEEARALREDTAIHYNCCQAVTIPFCGCCGVSRETAMGMATHFGGGMRHGSTCGAITGALMVLGLAGEGEEAVKALLHRFREKYGVLDCAHLLAAAKERGEVRKCHCDGMVYEAVAALEEILPQEGSFEPA